jgi:hypothetical protein
MGSFTESLQKNIERVKQEVDAKIIEQAQELFKLIVFYSPAQPSAQYAKGQFKNSWYAVPDGFNETSISLNYDSSGADSLLRIDVLKDSNAFYGKDGFVSLTNNLPYSRNIEYAGWMKQEDARWHDTPPYAPVRTAITLIATKQQGA